uniref:Uncharacterized protein n=1 Tax=Manihot esculenta TaxID=3983 RepID=A0A2C9UAC5_MANES
MIIPEDISNAAKESALQGKLSIGRQPLTELICIICFSVLSAKGDLPGNSCSALSLQESSGLINQALYKWDSCIENK